MMLNEKNTFDGPGYSIAYEERGSGPSTILIHGAGANRNYWKALSEEMPDRRVFMPDLYGHGETPSWPPTATYSRPYRYGDDVTLIKLIAKETDAPIHLIGHSSGGGICIEFAIKFPELVRSLVLIEPMLPTILEDNSNEEWLDVSSAYENVHSKVDRGDLAHAAQDLFAYILGDGEWTKLPEKIKNWMIQNLETTLAAHSRASLALPSEP